MTPSLLTPEALREIGERARRLPWTANARTDIPALLAHAAALQAERDELKTTLDATMLTCGQHADAHLKAEARAEELERQLAACDPNIAGTACERHRARLKDKADGTRGEIP